ncbi:hypothetical protein RB601_001463 [Gaeumannomyces tritici]
MDPHAGFDDVSPGDAEKKVKEAQESEPIKVGMTVETKDLFRDDHREPWQEWAPDDIGIASKSTPASAKFALIVRREKKNGKTDEPVLALHSITVQSPIIKKLLGPVFAGYRGINTNLKNQEFRAPFHEFFYRWGLFCAAEPAQDQGEEGEVERQHYKLLFDIISPEIATSIDQTKDLLKNGVISFEYVWALFEPGIEVYSSIDRQDRLSLLDSSGYQKLPDGSVSFKLTCRYVGTDGTHFGFVSTSQSISQFDKLMPVVELNVLPSHLHPGIDEIRPVLEEKGKKFESLLGVHHKSYFGFYTLLRMQNGASNKQFGENARIMVDCGSFMRHNSGSSIDLLPLDPGTVGSSRPGDPLDPSTSLDVLHDDYDDLASRTMRLMAQRASRMHSIGLKRSQATSLGKQHYALCTPLVRGYCLTSKKWGYFNVDAIRDITWNELAFKRLVLPHDYKETVLAFVHAQLSHADNFDDVIEGKGQGIIMLLSGEPGTGKTLTSESVAEEMKRPLYAIAAGELGSDAGQVEESLRRVLDLSTRWGAVLLLDECDVFLERRSSSNVLRNQLVSVFLRLLEYYRGVLLMTTNRAENLDPAFESRIHLSIRYPRLDCVSRLEIWRTFAGKRKEGGKGMEGLEEEELAELAGEELNGRQIKNVVKTARLLAARSGGLLRLEHVKMVLRVKNGEAAGFAAKY